MTAEIAIVNSQAVALAADSAITVGRERVWKHANKLFSLGPGHDIGVMIYNSGDFLGIPWEIIIKQFRSDVSMVTFPTLLECSNAFRAFLQKAEFANPIWKEISIPSVILDVIDDFSRQMKYANKKEMITEFDRVLEESSNIIDHIDILDGNLSEKEIIKRYKQFAKSVCDDRELFKYKLDPKRILKLTQFACQMVSRKHESAYSTGVVFAGFGKNEFLPVLQKCIVDGLDAGLFRYWQEDFVDLSADEAPLSFIRPFAQSDVAFLFVEGIISKYLSFLDILITRVLDDKSSSLVKEYVPDSDERIVENEKQRKDNRLIVSELMKGFESYRKEELVDELLSVITSLPKEEMATLAEAIVELTSLRRRMESQTDTVGGPIDVAVISKGDGFIWIKRKHYFDIEMNRDFLYRKRSVRRGGGSDEAEVVDSDRSHSGD